MLTVKGAELMSPVRCLLVSLGLPLIVGGVRADDWPQWGGTAARNMVAHERGIPATFVPGKKPADHSDIDPQTTKNVKWVAHLGSETYSTPTVAGGRVFIGTNDGNSDDSRFAENGGGALLALDEQTGRLLWRLVIPVCAHEHKSSRFDDMELGVCSTPTVDRDRVYIVTNRCEVLCADVAGLHNGNQGPFTDEARYSVGPDQPPVKLGPLDADILWTYDMIAELKVWPHDASCSSVLVHGDFLYVCTANGVDGEERPAPQAPSLIVLDKRTGRLVAREHEQISAQVFHGQWSSPAAARVNGRDLIFYGGGDGVCYAFEALTAAPTKSLPLNKVWSFQCNPPDRLFRDGKPINYWDGDKREDRGNRDDGKYIGPSEIIATPVVYRNRVYVAVGQDPVHGRGKGILNCIDATRTGDISQTGKVWAYEELDRSLSTVAIADGLLYVADHPGVIHCLDAETGRRYWQYDTKAEIWGATLVVDDKLYIGTRKDLVVLAAGKQAKLLHRIRLGSPMWASPVAANGVLYVASQQYLYAICEPEATPAGREETDQRRP